jgi:uncharacterized protein (TIGR03905 family)
MEFVYNTRGTCSVQIKFTIDEQGVIQHCEFLGGCHGNLIGISKLVVGRKAEEVQQMLKGIECRNGTSCPDQLSRALGQAMAQKA